MAAKSKSAPASELSARFQDITPEWAQKILNDNNIHNRPLANHNVNRLVRAMTRGRWKLNGDTICFGKSGVLLDGQHRLWAVVITGMTIQSLIVEGLDDDVFDTIDTGKRRTGADTLSTGGEVNAKRLSAALGLVDCYMTGRMSYVTRMNYDNDEVRDLLEKYPDARESIQTQSKAKALLSPSLVDACHYLFSRKDPELADEFVEKILRGTGLTDGSPWFALRAKLLQNSLSRAKLSKTYIFALCIKAWNYARTGKQVSSLIWRDRGERPEAFPIII